MKKDYKMIVAYDHRRGIGQGLSIPWYLPEDLKRFRILTKNQTVIMGGKTYRSIIERNGKPLPERKNIILSNTLKKPEFPNCFIYRTMADLLKDIDQAWIIGGAEIYKLFLPYTDKIYATEVLGDYHCDILFPKISENEWLIHSREKHQNFDYVLFQRRE